MHYCVLWCYELLNNYLVDDIYCSIIILTMHPFYTRVINLLYSIDWNIVSIINKWALFSLSQESRFESVKTMRQGEDWYNWFAMPWSKYENAALLSSSHHFSEAALHVCGFNMRYVLNSQPSAKLPEVGHIIFHLLNEG